MTHEELLKKISDLGDNCLGLMAGAAMSDSLRAVVEMHRPSPEGRYEKPICVECSFTETGHYVLYPCRNIQAIQKELG